MMGLVRLQGETPESFVDSLRNMPIDQAIETVKKSREAFSYVRGVHKERPKFISDAKDEVTSHERGYGDATKPEDYLREFREFIDTHMNEIAALNIVATRPNELTRQSLKDLKLALGVKAANLEELYTTIEAIQGLGYRELLVDVTGENIKDTFTNAVQVRRIALKEQDRTFGYPSIVFANKLSNNNPQMEVF